MNYIRLLIISLLLSSCATTNDSTMSPSSSGADPLVQSDSEKARYNNALSLLNNNQLEAAREIFLEFKSERPELAGPYANLAVIALKNNNYDKAFELVSSAVKKNPEFPEALNLLAYLEQTKGEIASAKKHYLDAIKYKEDYALAHYNIALLYDIYLQDIESAIPHYERYMSLINNQDKQTADWLEQIKQSKNKG